MASIKQEAINRKCIDCCYHESNGGTWREQIEHCPSSNCPLFEHRPKTIKTMKEERKLRRIAKTLESDSKLQDCTISVE